MLGSGRMSSRFRALAAGVVVACGARPEARPQHVLSVDTDLPLLGAPGASTLAAIDTLRIDVYEPDGSRLVSTRDFVMSEASSWPLSFGVAGAARVRLRAYRASTAAPSNLEPDPPLTVDRLVDLPAPDAVARTTQVVLRGDCIGHPAVLSAGLTCIDGSGLRGPASSGLGPPAQGSQSGTWSGARVRPCTTPPPSGDTTCVPGGYDVVGQSNLLGVQNPDLEPFPLRAVILSAIYMDRVEYTVGRFRRQLARPWQPSAQMPALPNTDSNVFRYCTFRGPDDDADDPLPLNCVDWALAVELCALDGGELPTEAQWEHVARAGDGRTYAWGAEEPRCCTTSASRDPSVDGGAVCPFAPVVEPAGAHPGSASCVGDVTPGGVLDLGGSVSELTRDRFASAATTWPPGVVRDPVSTQPVRDLVTKGGNFSSGVEFTRPAYRRSVGERSRSSLEGFRCVYRGERP